MADILPLATIKVDINPPLASALFDKGHDPILVAKLLITALQELVSVSSE